MKNIIRAVLFSLKRYPIATLFKLFFVLFLFLPAALISSDFALDIDEKIKTTNFGKWMDRGLYESNNYYYYINKYKKYNL